MADGTKISWTEATWNAVSGCTRVSEGCRHCYIERTPPFRMQHRRFDSSDLGATTGVQLHPERLVVPLHWRKPRRVFVNSLSDLFHEDVPDEFIARVFGVMALARRHSFQLLTKRHARMRGLLRSDSFRQQVIVAMHREKWSANIDAPAIEWPLPNLWMGVSAENQETAELRVRALLETPAAVRWVSAEPLLGPLDLRNLKARNGALIDAFGGDVKTPAGEVYSCTPSVLDWVVGGGESGPGARPVHPDWLRSLRDQCATSHAEFHLKQFGEWSPRNEPHQSAWQDQSRHVWVSFDGSTKPFSEFTGTETGGEVLMHRVGKKAAGRELDGVIHDGYPAGVA